MKKKLIIILIVIMILSTAAIPALAKKPHLKASGTWTYAPVSFTDTIVGCTLLRSMIDEGEFDGTFVGTEREVGVVTQHCNGNWSYEGDLSFTGSVDGKTGTLEMKITGKSANFTKWHGKWTILSGSDELENLRGHGTWRGAPGDLTYKGHVYFEPS